MVTGASNPTFSQAFYRDAGNLSIRWVGSQAVEPLADSSSLCSVGSG
jgi:hypothetical protein